MGDREEKKKKSRKHRERDLRDDGLKRGGLVDYTAISDHQIIDKRFEREKSLAAAPSSSGSSSQQQASTSTFDAFKRMAAGLEGRTLAEKIADPNRPTWEQYKKDNEDKLDMVGGEVRKMIEYRAELDRDRERMLKHGAGLSKQSHAISDSEESSSDGDSDNSSHSGDKIKKSDKKKSSKKEKKSKKPKKKSKKRKRNNGELAVNSEQES